jgi:hypothetical protein
MANIMHLETKKGIEPTENMQIRQLKVNTNELTYFSTDATKDASVSGWPIVETSSIDPLS